MLAVRSHMVWLLTHTSFVQMTDIPDWVFCELGYNYSPELVPTSEMMMQMMQAYASLPVFYVSLSLSRVPVSLYLWLLSLSLSLSFSDSFSHSVSLCLCLFSHKCSQLSHGASTSCPYPSAAPAWRRRLTRASFGGILDASVQSSTPLS
jgi:hypothetical protein